MSLQWFGSPGKGQDWMNQVDGERLNDCRWVLVGTEAVLGREILHLR